MLLEALVSSSALQLDRFLLRVMNRIFMSSEALPAEHVIRNRLEQALQFYTQPEFLADPDLFHVRPTLSHVPVVRALAPLPGGRMIETTFDSGFVPRNPLYREAYLQYRENQRIHLWQLEHDEPRPTVLYVHGWGGGIPSIELRMFPLRALYEQGYDVAMFTQPFHGIRTPRQARFGGQLFPSPRFERTNEGFAHAIHDLRVVLEYIRLRGRGPVGVMGASLGSYVASLLSGLEEDLAFLVLMIPLADLPEFMWTHGRGTADLAWAERVGLSKERLQRLYAIHSPLRLEPRMPPERVLILAGRGDGICTRAQTEALWHHFRHPSVHWFPGSHVAHFGRTDLLRVLGAFAAKGFEQTT